MFTVSDQVVDLFLDELEATAHDLALELTEESESEDEVDERLQVAVYRVTEALERLRPNEVEAAAQQNAQRALGTQRRITAGRITASYAFPPEHGMNPWMMIRNNENYSAMKAVAEAILSAVFDQEVYLDEHETPAGDPEFKIGAVYVRTEDGMLPKGTLVMGIPSERRHGVEDYKVSAFFLPNGQIEQLGNPQNYRPATSDEVDDFFDQFDENETSAAAEILLSRMVRTK